MNNFDLLSFRRKIIDNNIILLFEGKMSQGILVALVDTLKEKLNAPDETAEDRMHYMVKKLYAVFVELAQNIQNHSFEQEIIGQASIGIGIIVIRENADCFTLSSGNSIRIGDAEKLTEYCLYLNSLDKNDLKKLYKEKLRAGRQEDKKGAGIGLIEIKRKSDAPLEIKTEPLDEQSVFFTVSINLAKGELNGQFND
jgi:hypothetical protein